MVTLTLFSAVVSISAWFTLLTGRPVKALEAATLPGPRVSVITLAVVRAGAAHLTGTFEAIMSIIPGATRVVSGSLQTLDDTSGQILAPGSHTFAVFAVGLHVGRKLTLNWI